MARPTAEHWTLAMFTMRGSRDRTLAIRASTNYNKRLRHTQPCRKSVTVGKTTRRSALACCPEAPPQIRASTRIFNCSSPTRVFSQVGVERVRWREHQFQEPSGLGHRPDRNLKRLGVHSAPR